MSNMMRMLALLAVLALAACKAGQKAPPVERASEPEAAAPTRGGQGSAQGEHRMTVLNELLALFATEDGARWQSYDGIAGVAWGDAQPIETPEVADPAARFSRSGTLTLAGFGDTDLPDGKVGADAGVRRGNEGESGVTLSGDANRVNEVAIVKFYPGDDYEDILRQQFAADATLVAEADRCALNFGTQAENTGKNKFYRIEIGAATLAHVEAFVDEDAGPSGPGSTTFVFYRTKPEQRIAAMQCRAVQP
ncbi:MAG: hypothetical protein ABL934_07045 [Lysobacteraceae bacterium]